MNTTVPKTAIEHELGLVLTGGGARGAYQVGVLKWIARNYPEIEVPILTGVSAGAVNTAKLAAARGPESLVLWLGSAAILAVSAIVTRHNAWLSMPLALLVFTGIALTILDGPWTRLFDPFEYGFGSWVFVIGVMSTACVLILEWMATPEVTLD